MERIELSGRPRALACPDSALARGHRPIRTSRSLPGVLQGKNDSVTAGRPSGATKVGRKSSSHCSRYKTRPCRAGDAARVEAIVPVPRSHHGGTKPHSCPMASLLSWPVAARQLALPFPHPGVCFPAFLGGLAVPSLIPCLICTPLCPCCSPLAPSHPYRQHQAAGTKAGHRVPGHAGERGVQGAPPARVPQPGLGLLWLWAG